MFNTVNYILFQKRKELDNELLSEFSPYMVSRYMSFYDKDCLKYVNDTTNIYGSIFNGEEQFKFYENVIPILKRKKIVYTSKKKKEAAVADKIVPEFYSKREIEYLDI